MKHLRNLAGSRYLLFILLPLLVSGCKKDNAGDNLSITLSGSPVSSGAGQAVLGITSDGNWNIAISSDSPGGTTEWITPEKTSGTGDARVLLQVSENNTEAGRNAMVTVKSGSKAEKVLLIQNGAQLIITPNSIVLDNTDAPATINVSSSKSWNITNAGDAPWCRFSSMRGNGDAVITLIPKPFTPGETRQPVEIIFETSGEKKVLNLSYTYDPISLPELISPADGAELQTIFPEFSWTPSVNYAQGDIFYDVLLSSGDDAWSSLASGLTTTSYTPTTALDRNKTYEWKVRAYDGQGGERSSGSFSFTTPNISAPQLLSPVNNALGVSNPAPLTWSVPDTGEQGVRYEVMVSGNGVDWTSAASGLTVSSYTLPTPYDKWTYWKVIATDLYGGNAESDPCRFSVQTSVTYEDGEYWIIKENTVPNSSPFNIIIMGDGFIREDFEFGGAFESEVNEVMDGFFEIEPFRTYKDYFRVIAVSAHSNERGATLLADATTGSKPKAGTKDTKFNSVLKGGSSSNTTADNDLILTYAKKVPGIDDAALNNAAVFLLINIDVFAGTTTTWRYGRSVARTCVDANKTARLIHEGGGHGIGRLKDEYIDYPTQSLPDEDKTQITNYRADRNDPFWFAGNVDITGNREQAHWKHYFTINGYDRVGLYEGCYLYGKGAWKAEPASIMAGSKSTQYFNAPSREAIVRRIAGVTGNTFNFDDYLAKDVNTLPAGIRAKANAVYDQTEPYTHEPPEMIDEP